MKYGKFELLQHLQNIPRRGWTWQKIKDLVDSLWRDPVAGGAAVSGLGMDFVTGNPVALGLPSTIDSATVNAVTEHSHTHALGNIALGGVISGTPVEYGALYNWWAATDARGISSHPDWIILSNSQYNSLISVVGVNSAYSLMSIGFWASNNGTNTSKLNIRGGGLRGLLVDDGTFYGQQEVAYIIASDPYSANNNYFFLLEGGNTYLQTGDIPKNTGCSIILSRAATTAELLLPDGLVTATYTGNNNIVYSCTKIGGRIFINQPLNETKYRNGDWITGFDGGVYTPISDINWAAKTTGAMCYFDDTTSNGGGETPLDSVIIDLQAQVDSKTDEKVKYDAADPTAGYLADKVVQGANIALSEGVGADENKLKIAVTGLHAVATSGNYSDLNGKPAIPPAQVNSDWNAVTGVAQILNKPAIPPAYNLPTASAGTLGGVKVGSGLSIDGSGVLSASVGASSYIGLSDTSDTAFTGKDKNVPLVNEATGNLDLTPTELATFLILSDTPSTYTGHASKKVKVKADETGLEFVPETGGTESTTSLGVLIGSAGDATPNDSDNVATALTGGGILKKITWTNVKAFLKTYFDTLYNNYSHPANHAPSIITQDTSNRFVSDAEKNTWNGKSDLALGNLAANAYYGDKGKTAYDHSQAAHAPADAVSLATVKLDADIASAISLKHSHSNITDLNAVSGTNTGDNATNSQYSGLAGSKADVAQTMYIGTTQVAINRASAALTVAGLTLTTPDIGTPSAGNLANCSFPTLNQNTSGSAATLTTARNIGGRSFNGSADIVAPTWKAGITTKNITDASTTQTIAHGLGRVPSFVRIKGSVIVSAAIFMQCEGCYDGTNNIGFAEAWGEGTSTAATETIYTSTSIALGFSPLVATNVFTGANRQTGVITVDATNITITWTKTGTVASLVASLKWECT